MKYKQNLRIIGSKVYSYDTHVATIDHAGRRLLIHGHWSVTTSKHVNHVAETYGLERVKQDKPEEKPEDGGSMLKTVAMVAKMGALFCSTPKETNDWQARMLKAGLGDRGLIMPEDWDTLSEEEKSKRLNGAIAAIS